MTSDIFKTFVLQTEETRAGGSESPMVGLLLRFVQVCRLLTTTMESNDICPHLVLAPWLTFT